MTGEPFIDALLFAAAIVMVDTPGCSSANLRALPYRRLPRPIYPLDDFEFDPEGISA